MEEKELNELTQKLIDNALIGKHKPFELIRDFGILYVAYTLVRSVNGLISGFQKTCDALYDKYITGLKAGEDNVQLLIQFKTYDQCLQFYKEERAQLKSSIREYYAYLMNTGLIAALISGPRKDCEMFDYRTGEWYGESDD